MTSTIDATIPVEAAAAAALQDPATRVAVGQIVSRIFHDRPSHSPLAEAIRATKADARAAGLTDAEIDAELAAYNAERRQTG